MLACGLGCMQLFMSLCMQRSATVSNCTLHNFRVCANVFNCVVRTRMRASFAGRIGTPKQSVRDSENEVQQERQMTGKTSAQERQMTEISAHEGQMKAKMSARARVRRAWACRRGASGGTQPHTSLREE